MAHGLMRTVSIWSRMPPPTGGVARSSVLLIEALRRKDVATNVVDIGRPLAALLPAVRACSRSREWNLFNVSTTRSIGRAALIARAVRGVTCVFLHGGSFIEGSVAMTPAERDACRRSLLRFDEVWATNVLLAEFVGSVAPDASVRLVSPFPSEFEISRTAEPSIRFSVLVASYAGSPIYGVDTAVEAVDQLRQQGIRLSLDVVVYGPTSSVRTRLEEGIRRIPWATLWTEPNPKVLAELVAGQEAVLRPTERDGDSLLVREAIASGVRVIASGVVPRPAGVEIAERTPEAFAAAFVNGGELSTGDGLGQPVDTALMDALHRQ